MYMWYVMCIYVKLMCLFIYHVFARLCITCITIHANKKRQGFSFCAYTQRSQSTIRNIHTHTHARTHTQTSCVHRHVILSSLCLSLCFHTIFFAHLLIVCGSMECCDIGMVGVIQVSQLCQNLWWKDVWSSHIVMVHTRTKKNEQT